MISDQIAKLHIPNVDNSDESLVLLKKILRETNNFNGNALLIDKDTPNTIPVTKSFEHGGITYSITHYELVEQ